MIRCESVAWIITIGSICRIYGSSHKLCISKRKTLYWESKVLYSNLSLFHRFWIVLSNCIRGNHIFMEIFYIQPERWKVSIIYIHNVLVNSTLKYICFKMMFIYNLDFTYRSLYYCNYVYCVFLEETLQKCIMYYKSTSFITLLQHLSSLMADYPVEFPDTVNNVPFLLNFYSLLLLYSNNFQHARKICVSIKNFFHTQDERENCCEKHSVVSWVAIEKIARVHRIFYFG